jgi:small subunit ribosomal protein S1
MKNIAEGYIGQEKLTTGSSDAWGRIVNAYKKGTIYQARVNAIDSGGSNQAGSPRLIFWIERVKGIIPFKESSLNSIEDTRDIVGQIVAFKVKEIDEQRRTFTASRKEALEQMASLTWKAIEPGQVRVAAVRAITRYRAIADIGGVTVSIPAKEISYYWVDDVRDFLRIEDIFNVKVLTVDRDNGKIGVSIRALQPDPWLDDPDRLPHEGQKLLGTIAAVSDNGDRLTLRINVEPGFVCFCSCRKNKYIRHAKGDLVLVKIRDVEPQKRFILTNIIEQRNRCYSPAGSPNRRTLLPCFSSGDS